jgi:hypothetical protein
MPDRNPTACKGTLRQVFICLRPRTPYPSPPPLHTVYVYKVYLFTQESGDWGGWGELNQREVEKGNSSQSWVENTNMTECISSLNSKKTHAAKSASLQMVPFISAIPELARITIL